MDPDRAAAERISAQLHELADPERAAALGRFFQTGPGGYGEGDVFIGIRVPELRRVARAHRDVPVGACQVLLASEIHEERFVALAILRLRFERADIDERDAIADLYLRNRERVDNWDLVDASAPYLLADRVRADPRSRLEPLVESERLWDRRIAVLATFSLIREDEFRPTLELAERLLDDPHDLIQKAVGWMLREVGKRDREALTGFLDRHAAAMPRTMLRYALERLTAEERRRYMSA